MKDQLAKCGNNCGHCALFKDNLTDDTRQWCAYGMARYINWQATPERLRHCAGCQATEGFLYLKHCAVRLCAQYNGIENCAYCSVFPCPDVPKVSLSASYREQLAERLGVPIPDDEYLAFIEPYEGLAHLEALRAVLDAEQLVAPAPVTPVQVRMAAFPEDLAASPSELAGFHALYRLLGLVLTAQAEPRVRQVLLHKRQKYILNLLWVFGLYGQLAADDPAQLVIDGKAHGDLKAFTAFVRKRDNSLHTYTQDGADFLAGFGVHVKHIPLDRKSWLLKITFAERAGGASAARALQRYAVGLVEAYGRPVYAGAARYKGEAFSRFSRADMHLLSGH